MRVGSLFSGAGLLDLGLSLAGHEIVWHCEAEPWRRALLRRRYPKADGTDDVRDVVGPPRVDLLSGGPPCQPVSLAGLGKGDEDERWMWPEFLRVVRDVGPRYVLMENPSAILARGLGWILGNLAEIGYDAEWTSFPASAIGAPHRRDRTFILAYPNGGGWEGRTGSRLDDRGRAEPEDGGPGSPAGDSDGVALQQGRGRGQAAPSGQPRTSPNANSESVRVERGRVGRGGSSRSRNAEVPPEPGADGDPRPAADADRGGLAQLEELDGSERARFDWSLGRDAVRLGMDCWWTDRPPQPVLRSVDDGGPVVVDRPEQLAALGDGVVVPVAQWIGEKLNGA